MNYDDYNKSLGVSTISLAGGLPIDTEILQYHAKVDNSDELTNLQMYCRAAIGYIERETNRPFMQQTYTESFGAICGRSLRLSRYPATEIVEVKYLDENLEWQTLSSSLYTLSNSCVVPSVFELKSTESWPSLGVGNERVRITYKAGYTSSSSIPAEQIQALLFLTAHWYENRIPITPQSAVDVPLTVRAAIDLLKIYWL